MEDATIALICSTIIATIIAVINEIKPTESIVYIKGLTVQGEKGVMSEVLVWLGILKSAADRAAEKKPEQVDPSHISI